MGKRVDYTYIEKNLDKFHFFKNLYDNKKLCPLESVVPADSIPSWTTIYTGLNPAEHGMWAWLLSMCWKI